MKIYRISKGWRIFSCICASLFMLLAIWLPIMPFVNPQMNANKDVGSMLIVLSVVIMAFAVLGLVGVVKGRFVIDTDRVFKVGVFSTRTLFFNEIKGYTINKNSIFIEPSNFRGKRIVITDHISKKAEIKAWLAANYPDLDVLIVEQETKEILSNEVFGSSEEERGTQLGKGAKSAQIVNIAGGMAGAWAIFYPKPYDYMLFACIVVPVLATATVKYYKGLVRLTAKKSSAYPNVFWGFVGPSVALILKLFADFRIYNWEHVWLPSAAILAVFIIVLVVGSKDLDREQFRLSVMGIAVVLCFYSISVVSILNCFYDKSQPKEYPAEILSKRISTGKHTSYYIDLTPWGPRKEKEEITVSKTFYNSIDVHQQVSVHFYKGRFDIPWFEVLK